jgi:hypothetical protein
MEEYKLQTQLHPLHINIDIKKNSVTGVCKKYWQTYY